MKLKLTRPLIVFDLETTGIDISKDRIVELCFVKVHPDGTREVKTRRINPEMPIPKESTAIHGITDADVAQEMTFKQVANSMAKWLEGCDFAGFNSNRFDVPMLVEEFLRVGVDIDLSKRSFIDVQNIFHKKEQRTLSAAYKFYCDGDLENAHSAEADTVATLEVLLSQLERYEDLGTDVESLAKFSTMSDNIDFAGRIVRNEKGIPVFNFGKYKGRAVSEVFLTDPSYYTWMMNGDFTLNTKNTITQIRLNNIIK